MKPSELYARKPESISRDLWHLYDEDFYGLDIYDLDFHTVSDDNERISIHYYKNFCFDGDRVWQLASIKLDDDFVMIMQNAGRGGEDYKRVFITNFERYCEMVQYMKSLSPPSEDERLVDVDKDIPHLDNFYSNSLYDVFEPY